MTMLCSTTKGSTSPECMIVNSIHLFSASFATFLHSIYFSFTRPIIRLGLSVKDCESVMGSELICSDSFLGLIPWFGTRELEPKIRKTVSNIISGHAWTLWQKMKSHCILCTCSLRYGNGIWLFANKSQLPRVINAGWWASDGSLNIFCNCCTWKNGEEESQEFEVVSKMQGCSRLEYSDRCRKIQSCFGYFQICYCWWSRW